MQREHVKWHEQSVSTRRASLDDSWTRLESNNKSKKTGWKNGSIVEINMYEQKQKKKGIWSIKGKAYEGLNKNITRSCKGE